jgi:hypothetical protein
MPFTIDGNSKFTPYSEILAQGPYVLEMLETYKEYNGSHWLEYNWSHWMEDGNPNRTKTVVLNSDVTWTGVYSMTPPSPPIGGFSTSIDSKPFSLWLTSSIIIASFIMIANIHFKRKP